MEILVTGATGFVGSALIEYLTNIPNIAVVGMVRSKKDIPIMTAVEFRLGEIRSLNKAGINLNDGEV